jgi:endonuclease/exonuclease/phosphatase family metal-dependent hydrolase
MKNYMRLKRVAIYSISSIILILIILIALVRLVTFHPLDIQSEPVVCPASALILKTGQKMKILSWNVQYVFYYDLLDNTGPDERPSSAEITKTIQEVARIIKSENPDIILLQEIDDGAKRTDYQNQANRLLSLLPKEYNCSASTFYWKAAFVPHPHILGAVGIKLVVFSKYKMNAAVRHQLALIPSSWIKQQFNFKRAVLEIHLPVDKGNDLVVLDTHLEAFAQGTNTVKKQVNQLQSIIDKLTKEGFPWILGGDFNTLPSEKAYNRLSTAQRRYYNPKSELTPMFAKYQSVPSLAETDGPEFQRWFTQFPNDPSAGKPDRTIDYYFLSNRIRLNNHYIRQLDTLKISDHMPVIAELELK